MQMEIQRHFNISRIGVRNCIIRCGKMTCAVKLYPTLGFLYLRKFFLLACEPLKMSIFHWY